MTAPAVDINAIIPSKAKTWVGLIGSLLTIIGPYILSSADVLPAPWPGVIGIVFALLTAVGIYKAPYKPTGTTLAVDPNAEKVSAKVPDNAPVVAVTPPAVPPLLPRPAGEYQQFPSPWK